MDATRRNAIRLGLLAAGGAGLGGASLALADYPGTATGRSCQEPTKHSWRAGIEGQRRGDLDNGTYINPVLAGDRSDPNILKDGDDYYAVFSTFTYYPGVPIWHSRDLVNWAPVTVALTKVIGSVYALDLIKHDGRYFIYIPVVTFPDDPTLGKVEAAKQQKLKTFVIHAENIAGPWSEPIDTNIDGYIDPGHAVGENGKRYLFLSDGHRVRLTNDGLRRDGPIEKVYNGWPLPDDYFVEAFALEGPKVLRRDGWFYLFTAEGGTAGPPTSHMVIVARSRSIDGPWENAPNNPIVRTKSASEPWWSRGHATPVEGPDGRWWLVYHGYENGYRTLGRQMLLEPFKWNAEGWPVALGNDLSAPLPKPSNNRSQKHGQTLGGPFTVDRIGRQYVFYSPRRNYKDRLIFAGGGLTISGQGETPAQSSPMAFIAGDRAYSIECDVQVNDGGQGGLLLFYSETLYCGLGFDHDHLHSYILGNEDWWPSAGASPAARLRLRLVNHDQIATFYLKTGTSKEWHKLASCEVSGYHHNIGRGFVSLRPALFACGKGNVTFSNLTYEAIE